MQHREEFEKKVDRQLTEFIGNVSAQREFIFKLVKNWDFPLDLASDLTQKKIGLLAESDFILYALAVELKLKNLDRYYSDMEQKEFSKSKFYVERLKFPVELNMIRVASDQWIGSIMISDLMKFRDAQIITYNENTQRTIQRVVRGEDVYYRITVDDAVVSQIAAEYEEEQYIPNTLTFNLPATASFEYDEENKKLIIYELDNLDIIDGYHRYLGATKALMKDPKLDFPMELRIVSFSENKARHFIWQEDQKTKMTKLDSRSFNQHNYGNTLTQYLDMNPAFTASGLINKRGIIDPGYFGQILDDLAFWKLNDKEAKDTYLNLRKTLINDLNNTLDEYPSLLEHRWSYKETLAVLYVTLNWQPTDGNKEMLISEFNEVLNEGLYKNIKFQEGISGNKKQMLSRIYKKVKERGENNVV